MGTGFRLADRIAMLCGLLALAASPLRANGPRALIDTPTLALGNIARGTDAEGVIVVRNQGDQVLQVALIRASERMVLRNVPVDVMPGGAARIPFSIRTDGVDGLLQSEAVLALNDAGLPEATVRVVCRVADPIEVIPKTGFGVNVVRGHVEEAAVEIVNHERAPLSLNSIASTGTHFDKRLEALEPGRRYRLTIVIPGDGPEGARGDVIAVRTSSSMMPVLEIPVRTTLRERVQVTPRSVDLRTIRLSDAARDSLDARETLVVTGADGGDFSAAFVTDLPMLDIQARRAPGANRWHATIALKRDALQPGPIRGYIFVQTNDPEYPSVSVPVVGEIVPN